MNNVGHISSTVAKNALAISLAGAALVAVPAHAQSSDTGDETNEANSKIIIVTAQRRAQNLQDVPAAVTALSSEQLESRQITSTADLQNQIPNAVISNGTGTASSARIFFRGIGEDESRGAVDPAVGIYIDNVFLGRTVGSMVDLVDIAQIEVLRGPQGTLYGRNTNGGAIKITSVKPQIGETSLSGKIGYGNYDRVLARATGNVELWEDAALRVSGMYKAHNGYSTVNPNGDFANLAGIKAGEEEVYAIRGSFLGKMSPVWSFQLAVDYTNDKSAPVPSSIIARSDNPGVVTDRDGDIFTVEPAPGISCSNFTPALFQRIGCFTDFRSEIDAFGVSGHLIGDYGDFSISSTTAYRTLKDDLSTHITFPFTQQTDQNQFSQEFLVNSNFGGAIDVVAGAYYYSEDVDLDYIFVLPINNRVETESFAVFGQASLTLMDALTLTAGARYTMEDREFSGTSPATGLGAGRLSRSSDINKLTYTGKVDYAITDDILVYGSFSTGFKAPGFSSDCFRPAACFLPVKEEELDSYEAGIRTQFADGNVTFNATYFYNNYSDLQISATIPNGAFTRSNAGDARIQGVELEASVTPLDGLNIYANASYLDASYRNLTLFQSETLTNSSSANGTTGPACGPAIGGAGTPALQQQVIDCATNLSLKNAPEYKGVIGFNYTFTVGTGAVFFGSDASYEEDSFALVSNPPGSLVEPGVRVDARIGYRANSDKFTVTLWGKNLTDRDYFRATTSVNQAYAAPPLTFGVDIGFKFD